MSTVSEIKKIALALFAKKGYDGTSLAEIAAGVGIKKPSLYAHFNGKEDLFLTVFRETLDRYVQMIRQTLQQIRDASVEVKLREILYSHCRYYMTHSEDSALLKRAMLFPPNDLASALQDEFLASEEALTALIADLFRAGIASGIIRGETVEDLMASYYCLIDGLFVQMFYYKKEDFESKMQSAWKIFWNGIAVRR